MNNSIAQLHTIAQKKERYIIGLMSGTSLDGLDIALCKCSGSGFNTNITLLEFETIAYDDAFLQLLKNGCFATTVPLQQLTLLHKQIATVHATLVNDFLQKNNLAATQIDAIASHGQTIYHAPAHTHCNTIGNATLQLGDGDIIAVNTGIITISDFRQKNIAAGGAGAPLATYGDLLLFGNSEQDVLLLNIGGIANATYLPQGYKNKLVATDIGPGNTLMNQWMQQHYQQNFDDKGAVAAKGYMNETLLNIWLSDAFFKKDFPKTTGPETFNHQFIEQALLKLPTTISNDDVIATLNFFTAKSIALAIENITTNKTCTIYISGGGVYNTTLQQHLQQLLPQYLIVPSDQMGLPAAAKEAMLFALLANETLAGNPNTFEKINQHLPAVCMGKISLPF